MGLRELKDLRAVSPLLRALDDESALVRREAVITLAYLRLPESVSPLRKRLRDEDESVRRVVIGALAYFNGPALLEDFLRALSDVDWRVRAEAAIVLGRSGLSGAIAGLRTALNDPYWQVQKEARRRNRSSPDGSASKHCFEARAGYGERRHRILLAEVGATTLALRTMPRRALAR